MLIALQALVLFTGAPTSGTPRQGIDPAAVVRESDRLLFDAQTATGTFRVVRGNGSVGRVDFALDKPTALSLRSAGRIDVFDGRKHIIANPGERTYEERDADAYGIPYLIGFTAFVNLKAPNGTAAAAAALLPKFGAGRSVEVAGKRVVRRSAVVNGETIDVDLDPATKLPVRWTWVHGGETITAFFENVVLNGPIPVGTFDVPALTAGATVRPTAEEVALPAIGASPTLVTGPDVTGRSYDLGAEVRRRRTTIVAFITAGHPASADALQSLANLSRRVELRNVGVVAVIASASRAETNLLLENTNFSGRRSPGTSLDGATALEARKSFGVALPLTVFVLDAEGRVRARSIGYDEPMLLSALDIKAGDAKAGG